MSLLRRTILLTLSLLVLMSSVGFSVGLHMCAGTLQNMAFFHKAEACPMEQKQEDIPCHKQDPSATTESSDGSCCEDSLVVMDDVENAVTSKVTVSLESPDLYMIAVIQTAFLFLLPQTDTPQVSTYSYLPPTLVRDIPVLVQSFLI